jgi:hypothetical protein
MSFDPDDAFRQHVSRRDLPDSLVADHLVDAALNIAICEIMEPFLRIDLHQGAISVALTIFECLQELQKSCCRSGRCSYHGGTAPPCYGEYRRALPEDRFLDLHQTRAPRFLDNDFAGASEAKSWSLAL